VALCSDFFDFFQSRYYFNIEYIQVQQSLNFLWTMAWLASCSLVIMDEHMLNANSKETDPGAELMLHGMFSRYVCSLVRT